MTVKELIKLLETVEDKDKDILIEIDGEYTTDFDIIENCSKYYGKCEDEYSWVSASRICHILG